MRKIDVCMNDAKLNLSRYADELTSYDEFICVSESGTPRCGIVGLKALDLLESIPLLLDLRGSAATLTDGGFVPWDEAKSCLP